LHAEIRGRLYTDVLAYLQAHYADVYACEAFRRGFERGQAYRAGFKDKHQE